MITNLITDKWLPVVRKNGKIEEIRPCDITSDFYTNPVIRFNIARPDFNGALVQFLIGLVQTAFPPQNITDCQKYYNTPPNPEELQSAFLTIQEAFNIQGDGPLFMQDFNLLTTCKNKNIGQLFIEEPGDQTLNNNTDLFIKRNRFENVTLQEAIIALYTLQQNAPSGGAGHRTSIRGGGPLTTLLIPPIDELTLWKTVWMNISLSNEILPTEKNLIFPWLSATCTSVNNEPTTPENSHNLQCFWGMPRRIRLIIENNLVKKYKTETYGVNYISTIWKHPLTPYRAKNEKCFPVLTPKNWTYENWLDIAISNDKNFHRATCIQENNCGIANARIWCFGYETDNMKAISFVESITPYYNNSKREFIEIIENMVLRAATVAGFLVSAINQTQQPKSKYGSGAKREFWARTENKFFQFVEQQFNSFELNSKPDEKIIQDWFVFLNTMALTIFSEYVEVKHVRNFETQVKTKHNLKLKLFKKIENENLTNHNSVCTLKIKYTDLFF